MAYTDPITKNTYPSKEWMLANKKNLPEVLKAYPDVLGNENIGKNFEKTPNGIGEITGGLTDEITKRATGAIEEAKTPQDVLTNQLTENLTKYANAPTLTEEKIRLEEEKGVSKQKEIVGSFEDEVMKTQNLLDTLEEDITKRTQDYLVNESQRSRVYASEQAPLLKSLNISERGLTSAQGRLSATNTDILNELGLIEKEKSAPLDLLEREVSIRSKIKDLATANIPNIATTQYNDDGDLTIVTQDPNTGKIETQTVKGIGKKASEYESYQTTTNDNGDLTIIGISRDGTPKQLGTFKGVGTSKKTTETEAEAEKYTAETAQRVISSVDNLMGRANSNVLGISKFTSLLPGTAAYDFASDLTVLKSNIAFNALQAMRNASKTGGALGQVSEKELALLESTLGALDQGQSPENFKRNLQIIRDSVSRWTDAVNQYGGEVGNSGSSAQNPSYEYNGIKYDYNPSDGLYYPRETINTIKTQTKTPLKTSSNKTDLSSLFK